MLLGTSFHTLGHSTGKSNSIVIKAPAGTGKTREVIETIRVTQGLVIWFAVPNRGMGSQIKSDLDRKGHRNHILVLGRSQKISTSEKMCARDDEQIRLARAGIDVQKHLCGRDDPEKSTVVRCPHFDTCPYQDQRRRIKNAEPDEHALVLILMHSHLAARPAYFPNPDLVIVDEAHWQWACQESKMDVAELYGLPGFTPEFIAALEDPKLLKKIRSLGFKTESDFTGWIDRLSGEINQALERIHDEDSKINQSAVQRIALLRKARRLLRALAREIGCRRDVANGVEVTKERRLIVHCLQNFELRDVPLLILDATADTTLLGLIWDRRFELIEVACPRKAEIIQVSKKFFSRQSITGKGIRDKLWNPDDATKLRQQILQLINKAVENVNDPALVGVIATKQVLEVLKPHLPEGIKTAHFMALRGLNSLEDCKVGIVIGREQPSPQALERQARAFLATSDQLLKQASKYSRKSARRKTKGGIEHEEVDAHPDPMAQRLLLQVREREIEQAIDRLRLIHNGEKKLVLVLCALPLDLVVDWTVRWKRLIGGGSRLEQAVQRGLPVAITPSEMKRLYPDLWPTKDAAKSELRRIDGEKGVISQIVILFGNRPLFRVTYRRPGQRGHSSVAIATHPVDKSMETLGEYTIINSEPITGVDHD